MNYEKLLLVSENLDRTKEAITGELDADTEWFVCPVFYLRVLTDLGLKCRLRDGVPKSKQFGGRYAS